ncbi:MAG: YbaK/EbsC family protein [Minisyncoccia bacterium]
MRLGNLEFLSALGHHELMAPVVGAALARLHGAGEVGAALIDASFSDTAAFCEHYQIDPESAANCIILEASRGEEVWLAACVVLATTRADINGLARQTLDARRVSFAPMEKATAESHMEFGAITPIGLPNSPAGEWPILVDQAVAESEYVVIGSGIRKSKLLVPGGFFAGLPNAHVFEGLGKRKSI